jgi:hypothetical protein
MIEPFFNAIARIHGLILRVRFLPSPYGLGFMLSHIVMC